MSDGTLTMTIAFNTDTNEVSVSFPNDPMKAYALLKLLQDAVFAQARKPAEPERAVKTLDEMGMNPGLRIHRS